MLEDRIGTRSVRNVLWSRRRTSTVTYATNDPIIDSIEGRSPRAEDPTADFGPEGNRHSSSGEKKQRDTATRNTGTCACAGRQHATADRGGHMHQE